LIPHVGRLYSRSKRFALLLRGLISTSREAHPQRHARRSKRLVLRNRDTRTSNLGQRLARLLSLARGI